MSAITIIWSMVASACLTLAGLHALVWFKNRRLRAHLFFSLTAAATASISFFEMGFMRAGSPGEFGVLFRWAHIPVFIMLVSLVVFVRVYFNSGRPWLAWAVVGTRAVSLLFNFTTGVNLNYQSIHGLRHLSFLGETVSVAEGPPNPWMAVGQVGLIAFLVFILDAARAVWRRGDRLKALTIGGSVGFFVVAGLLQSLYIFWDGTPAPIMISLYFMVFIGAMSLELSRDVLKTAQLSNELRMTAARLRQASQAAGFGVYEYDMASGRSYYSPEFLALYGLPPLVAAAGDGGIPADRSADAGGFRGWLVPDPPGAGSSVGHIHPGPRGPD